MNFTQNVNNLGARTVLVSSTTGSDIVLFEGKSLSLSDCKLIRDILKENYTALKEKNDIIMNKNEVIRETNVKLIDTGNKYMEERQRIYRWGSLIQVMCRNITSTKITLMDSIHKLSQLETETSSNHILLQEAKKLLIEQLANLHCDSLNENPSDGERMYFELQQRMGGNADFLIEEARFSNRNNVYSQETFSDSSVGNHETR